MIQNIEEITKHLMSAKGEIDRIYAHWTAAPYRMTDFMAYHAVIDRGGCFHVMHSDFTRVLSHTWRRNGRSLGVAMACACGACCWYDAPSGVDLGEAPSEEQIEALALFVGTSCFIWDFLPVIFIPMRKLPKQTATESEAVTPICGGTFSTCPIMKITVFLSPAVVCSAVKRNFTGNN